MVISFDYDETYTADPATFRRVILLFKSAGWTPIICTGRNDSSGNVTEVMSEVRSLDIPVIFAGGVNKREACRKYGFPKVQVWVDDCPAMVDGTIPILKPGEAGSD